tara:strand:- start:730 stop:918 length:189 start_codon:yes stop_codon:yes gene_type:complete
MKANQPKIRAIRDLQTITNRLKMIEDDSQEWSDINKEGVTGFLMHDALESINEQISNLINKF